jgi:exodeoxyribonuclease VII large subunit
MLSVSELTSRARQLLEYELANLWVVGEVASISRPASGHWYFSLKDDKAQIRCVMFRQQNLATKPPAQGDSILVCGRISLYEARGDFQMIVSVLEHRGAGALHMRFEKLKQQLQEEGLFAPQLKTQLPRYPKTIGIVTSATGAALQDISSVLERHCSPVSILLYPCIVQGDQAPSSIRRALELANTHNEAEILIVGRGGGSYEDLFCFNDEALARDIRRSGIPIISAVGHEVDFTISDFVADVRAPTPTAAMELALRLLSELPAKIQTENRHLNKATTNLIALKGQRISGLKKRLRNPQTLIEQQRQGFDRLINQLQRALSTNIVRSRSHTEGLRQRLVTNSPSRQLAQFQSTLKKLCSTLPRQTAQQIKNARMELARQASVLETVSPLSTVARGYAIVFDKDDQVVRSVDQVEQGDNISARISDGALKLSVTSKRKHMKSN